MGRGTRSVGILLAVFLLGTALALRADSLPEQVTLTAPADASIRQGDRVAGTAQLPAGTKGKPLSVEGDTLLVDFNGLTASVPIVSTDFKPAPVSAPAPVPVPGVVPPKPEPDRIAPLVRGDLIGLEGSALRDCAPSRLDGIKYYAIYYSAQWCPPCHAFTPRLVQFYNQFKPTHPQFELIFVSLDNDARAQVDYMREMHMPWPAVRFEALYNSAHRSSGQDIKSTGIGGYASTGIPDLVLVSAAGNVLSDSFDSLNKYLGPEHVLEDIQARVK